MKNLKTIILITLLFVTSVQAQWRPRLEILDDWALVATNTVREGTTQDIGLWQSATLYISHAMGTDTSHTGTGIVIQTSPADSGDDTWFTQGSFTLGVGTASSTVLDVTPNAGSTTVLVNYTTTLMEADVVKSIFLLGSPTVTDSELLTLVSHSADTSITVLDGLALAPGASSTVWDFAETVVYELPIQTNRVRVLYDTTNDPDGAWVYTYAAIFGISP